MTLSGTAVNIERNITVKLHFILDNLLPPLLRDSKWFMYLFFWILFKKKAKIFIEFKDKNFPLTDAEFKMLYHEIQDVLIQRTTDLNKGCFNAIIDNVLGKSVLEAGCGSGVLSGAITCRGYRVTVSDIVINKDNLRINHITSITQANVENLPFKDNSFDTVICAHTLEHVQHIHQAIRELRRVAVKRLIIVVPKQRPYKFTFDLHLHFFPYQANLLALMGKKDGVCQVIDGDLFYVEDISNSNSN